MTKNISVTLDVEDLRPSDQFEDRSKLMTEKVLDLFSEMNIRATIFVVGDVAKNHPEIINKAVKDGHEIGYHGYIHEAPNSLSHDQEHDWMCRSIEIIERHTGKRPRGNRAPLYHMSAKTPELLAMEGFLYDSSLMGDEVPYVLQTPKGQVLELPVSWATDDWPPYVHAPDLDYMFQIVAPDRAMEVFMAEFEALRACPGGLWIGVWHPFVSGRLSRWQRVEKARYKTDHLHDCQSPNALLRHHQKNGRYCAENQWQRCRPESQYHVPPKKSQRFRPKRAPGTDS